MTELPSVEELNSQVELRKTRLTQVIDDIRSVLRSDIDAFVRRETKRAFLTQAEVSNALSTAKVADLKRGMTALAEGSAARIATALEDRALWAQLESTPGNTRELTGATGVWKAVTSVQDDLAKFLGGFGLDAEQPVYKAPAYFVDGRYLPSLAEHFWRLVHEIDELRAQASQLEANVVRAKLEAKWDEA